MTGIGHRETPSAIAPDSPESMAAVRKLMRWDPFLDVDVAKVARDAEALFTPAFDVLETEGCYAFLADLPGVREQELEVSWAAGRITISGTREPEALGEGADFYALERTFGRFVRSFSLPASALPEKTSATLQDGVLRVLVPKTPADQQPARIPVQGGLAQQDGQESLSR